MTKLLTREALEADKKFVQGKLSDRNADPWGTVGEMWKQRLAEIDEKLDALSAETSLFASVALIFDGDPVLGTTDIRVDFTTQALDAYQKLVAAELALQSTDTISSRGPLPESQRSRLYIRDILRGSVGFILEEPATAQHALVPSPLKEALEASTQLLKGLNSGEENEFEARLADAHPRLISAVRDFTRVLSDAGASAKIYGEVEGIVLTRADTDRLSRRLSEIQTTDDPEDVFGVLLGILPESKRFEFRGQDQVTIHGAISEGLATDYTNDSGLRDRTLLQRVQASIRVVRTTRNGRVVKERRTLERVTPVDTL